MVFHQSHQQRNHRPIQQQQQIQSKKQRLAVTRNLLRLFIELDELDGSPLKKAVPVIRNQPETAREQEVEVIDLDAATNNFDYVTATEK